MPTETHHYIDKRAAKVATEIAAGGDPDELLSTSELAEITGLSTQFYEIGRVNGYGPKFVRLSPRRVRYRRADVLAWLEERTYARTAEYEHQLSGRKLGSRVVGGAGRGGAGGSVLAPGAGDEAA